METITQDQTIQPETKPRNVWIALLFSLPLFAPGLGQLYNGQIKKSIIFLVAALIFIFPVGLLLGSFNGFVLLLIIAILFRIYILIDAIIYANRQKLFIPKNYNKWYFYIIYIVVSTIAVLIYRPLLGYYSFTIPAASNEPTVVRGDYVWADKSAYNNKKPDYGDIVIFKKADGQIYAYRVVGLPNDKLLLNDDFITINGQQCKTTFIKDILLEPNLPAKEYEEDLPNGHKHHLYKLNQPFQGETTSLNEITIPSDSYFLLGDNRDNALDSRYTGFVKKQDIQGQLIYSVYGKTKDRINIDYRDK